MNSGHLCLTARSPFAAAAFLLCGIATACAPAARKLGGATPARDDLDALPFTDGPGANRRPPTADGATTADRATGGATDGGAKAEAAILSDAGGGQDTSSPRRDGASGGPDGATGALVDGRSGTGPDSVNSGGRDGSGSAARSPAQLLNLKNWKLQLPIPKAAGTDSLLEIKRPQLDTFSHDQHFHLNENGDGVVFRAHAGGVTTSGSSFPRSELREMTNNGASTTDWSTIVGTHTLIVRQAITHLPKVRPHVVAAQIHDSDADLIQIRLENRYLFVHGKSDDLGALEKNYVLGTPFTVKIVAGGGEVRVFYNDMNTPKVTLLRATANCYFKAGAYTQSNLLRGDAPDAYGEVVIYQIAMTHE